MDKPTEKEWKEMADGNRKSIIKQVKQYKNTLVIFTFDVVELLDWVDGEDDYYWVYNNGSEIHWDSCVGGFIPLKEYLPTKVYEGLYRTWGYNNQFNWDGGERLEQVKANGWRDTNIKRIPEEQELLENIFGKKE
jgi:hypothetical protein